MIKHIILTLSVLLLTIGQSKAETDLGKIPDTDYRLYESDDKCVAGTAFRLGNTSDIVAKFALVREKTRGNSIVIIDPRIAGVNKGTHQGKIIWMFDDKERIVYNATITSTGTEDITYYLTREDAKLFPTASAVGFKVRTYAAGFNLDGAIKAVRAANRCGAGL